MLQSLIGASLLSILAQAPGSTVSSLPPVFAMASMNSDGTISLVQFGNPMSVAKTMSYQERGEQYKTEIVQTTRMVTSTSLDHKLVQGFETDGTKIPASKLANLIRREVLVLISADGDKVDPYYLSIVKPGTPILVVPGGLVGPSWGGYGMPPMPADPSAPRPLPPPVTEPPPPPTPVPTPDKPKAKAN